MPKVKPPELPPGIEPDPRHAGRYRVRFTDQEGRRHRYGSGLALGAARDLLARKKAEVLEGRYQPKRRKDPRLAEFIATYLKLVEGRHRDRETQIAKGNLWTRAIGDKRLSEIRADHIEAVLAGRASDGRAPATLNRDLAFIRRVLNVAIDHELLDANPSRPVKKYPEDNRREIFLTPEEEARLMAELDVTGRAIVQIALLTGARRGNVVGLRWSEVDLANLRITFRWTKSGKPYHVPITDKLAELLRSLPTRLKGEWVFGDSSNAEPMKGARFYADVFKPAATRAGLDGFRFHDLRHTVGSRLVMAGVDLITVKELLGHRTLATTERYAHLADEHKRQAMKRLARYQTVTKSVTARRRARSGRSSERAL